ncbi:MAG: chromate transporter [Clostridia bacterium]|nr:chromate transporter [Clostridia bacterium]
MGGIELKKDFKLYWTLFSSTFFLSAFTFGGGYVIVPLMKKKFSDELHWIEEKEILDLTAIAQSSPGPIAVNAAILIGQRIGGMPGALLSVLGAVLPPLIIISVISSAYAAFRDNAVVSACLKGMQSGVAAVIADVVFGLGGKIVKSKSAFQIGLMIAAFIATWFFGVNVVFIILFCGVLSAAKTLYAGRKGGRDHAA